jgi:hypothetical protein
MMAVPDKKLIYEFLAASGATAICLLQGDAGCELSVGRCAAQHEIAPTYTYWIDETLAAKVARLARKNGLGSDLAGAAAALHQAAAFHKVHLTPHTIAVSRATFGAKKLLETIEQLSTSGLLREFNLMYRRHRSAAADRGVGYMSYPVAMARLRRMLIERLVKKEFNGKASFEEIFVAAGSKNLSPNQTLSH